MVYKDGKDIPNYVGDWVKDEKHGQGRYIFKSATYEGEWVHGKTGGHGIQTQLMNRGFPNPLRPLIFAATVYDGIWLNGLPHGRYRMD